MPSAAAFIEIQAEDTPTLTVPNGTLAKQSIRNLTRRTHWTIAATFSVPHTRQRPVAEDMEGYLRGRPDFSKAGVPEGAG